MHTKNNAHIPVLSSDALIGLQVQVILSCWAVFTCKIALAWTPCIRYLVIVLPKKLNIIRLEAKKKQKYVGKFKKGKQNVNGGKNLKR